MGADVVDVDGSFSGTIAVPAVGARARIEARSAWWRRRHECDVIAVEVAPLPPLAALRLPSVGAPPPPTVSLPPVHVQLEVP